MKINKIIYFLHGWYLIRKNVPLIRNHIEAWHHGPVIRVVYDAFKEFENRPICSFARHLNYETGKQDIVKFDNNSEVDPDFLIKVASHYIKYTASELRGFTHLPDSPWIKALALVEKGELMLNRVPNDLIRKHFFLLAEVGRTH